MAKPRLRSGCGVLGLILFALAGGALALFVYQGGRTPVGRPEYVALGSSFAAGAGLGPLQPGSPTLCARTLNGYPQQLARMRRLSIVDVSCGGGKARHLLDGGQYFQGAQVRTIDKDTRLVTVTVGGNDVGYVGDLSLLAARNSNSFFGWMVRHLWSGPKAVNTRDFRALQTELAATLRAIHERAPSATVILATYPTLLPPSGTCARIGLTDTEAKLMRQVGNQLAATTRAAAAAGGASVVDMHVLGATHNACSPTPWVEGWVDAGVAPFHPNLEGARATAEAVSRALDRPGASPGN